MNMQFGFGGYDPYMMMGYGASPQMSSFGGFPSFGGGMGFGGGGMFPNYYPMFNPQALGMMGQQFFQNQFVDPVEAAAQRRADTIMSGGVVSADYNPDRDNRVKEILAENEFEPTQAPEEQMAAPEDTEIVSADQVGQTGVGQMPQQPIPTRTPLGDPNQVLKNPVSFDKAGKFDSAGRRTEVANNLLAQTKGGGYGKVRKLVRTGKVKAAQKQIGKAQRRKG